MAAKRRCSWMVWGVALAALLSAAAPVLAEGFVSPAVGPVNTSMGGVATAAPLDAIGALHWNPATIAGLAHSEMGFGVKALYGSQRVSSAVRAGAFGPGLPATPLSGSNFSDSGVSLLPAFGIVHRPEDSPLTYGLGLYTIGGFAADYPASRNNPVLTPPPPNGFGAGSVYSQLQVIQIAPTLAYQLTDRVSVGFAPTLTVALLQADPALFAAPDDANGDGFRSYPGGTHTRTHFGGGFQAGVYYSGEGSWGFGASVKSPQWFEPFRYNAEDERGRHRRIKLGFDYPLIASAGVSYAGFERWLLAADLRYLDFGNTRGLRDSGFDASGALRGLGWDSTFLVAVGAQYEASDSLTLRVGYSYSPGPVPDAVSGVNVASALIEEHIVYLGASCQVTGAITASLAYSHSFSNSITGPFLTPLGPIAGTSITNDFLSADAVTAGVSVAF